MKKSTLILTILGSLGVVGTAYLAAKATPDADVKIRSDSKYNHDGDPYAYTKKEALESGWKFYIPAAAVGTATIACIIGANVLNHKQQASLASAYALVSESYKKYTDAVKKVYGEEGHKKVIEAITIDKAEYRDIYSAGVYGPSNSLSVPDSKISDIPRTFYEPYSNRYFESTMNKVIEAEYHINRNFALGAAVSVNDFYDFLGIEKIKGGNNVGWCMGDEICWIDFDHNLVTLDDGMEVVEIDMLYYPDTDSFD